MTDTIYGHYTVYRQIYHGHIRRQIWVLAVSVINTRAYFRLNSYNFLRISFSNLYCRLVSLAPYRIAVINHDYAKTIKVYSNNRSAPLRKLHNWAATSEKCLEICSKSADSVHPAHVQVPFGLFLSNYTFYSAQ